MQLLTFFLSAQLPKAEKARERLLTLNQWLIRLSAFQMTEQVFKPANLWRRLWHGVLSLIRLFLLTVRLMICSKVAIFTTVYIAGSTAIRVSAQRANGRRLSVTASLPKKRDADITCAIFQLRKALILSVRLRLVGLKLRVKQARII